MVFKRPKAALADFTLNLAAVLNDPGRDKQANLFTDDWGDDFVPNVRLIL